MVLEQNYIIIIWEDANSIIKHAITNDDKKYQTIIIIITI